METGGISVKTENRNVKTMICGSVGVTCRNSRQTIVTCKHSITEVVGGWINTPPDS